MSINFRSNKAQDFEDWGGKHQAVYAGTCVVCGTRVYSERDAAGDTFGPVYDPDPRGMIGDHSASHLIASEYDKTGADVVTCFNCQNEEPKYRRALKIALEQWK